MRKFFHYAGNIAVMFLAFVIYTLLEEFYFYPQLIHLRYHIRNQAFVTAVLTVLVMGYSVFGMPILFGNMRATLFRTC